MNPPTFLSLSDLVKATADELRAIHASEPNLNNAVMKFTECEIELSVLAKVEVDGKVKFWVVEAGGGASYENASKVTLKFTSLPGAGIYAAAGDVLAQPAPLPRGS